MSLSPINLKVVVLRLLKETPMHGYQLTKSVEQFMGKEPSSGALHPLITKMEDEGLVISNDSVEHGRYKKIFTITEKGKSELHEMAVKIMDFLQGEKSKN